MVVPVSFRSVNSCITSLPLLESRFPVGSSARISFGEFKRARAISTLCCSPPLSKPAAPTAATQLRTVGAVIVGTYGQLTLQANGNYSYVRNAGSPGGVTDTFTYTVKDGDGDLAHTTLTISIGDAGVTTNIPAAGGATTTVYEAALAARGSEPQGTSEALLPGANDDTREAVSGTIGFTAADGLGSISLGGTLINLAGGYPQTVNSTATGTLVVTGVTYNAVTGVGSIAYTYTLLDNTLVDPSSVSFALSSTGERLERRFWSSFLSMRSTRSI